MKFAILPVTLVVLAAIYSLAYAMTPSRALGGGGKHIVKCERCMPDSFWFGNDYRCPGCGEVAVSGLRYECDGSEFLHPSTWGDPTWLNLWIPPRPK